MVRKFNSCFDLFLHIDVSEIFTGIQMVSLLHLVQFSHLVFEECHSELCGLFGISRNSIFFHKVNFLFRLIDKTRQGARRPFLKNCASAIITSPEVIIRELKQTTTTTATRTSTNKRFNEQNNSCERAL